MKKIVDRGRKGKWAKGVKGREGKSRNSKRLCRRVACLGGGKPKFGAGGKERPNKPKKV